jgi:Rieske Fe-S protein
MMRDPEDMPVEDTSCDACPAPSLARRRLLSAGSCTIVAWLTGVRWSEAAGMPAGNGGQERTYPIPAADGVIVDREAQVILVRQQQEVYAFNLSCPHQNAAVRWNAGGQRFQCSRHDSRYAVDGTHTSGRATRNMDRFPIHRDGATLVVDVSRFLRSDQDSAAWAAAHVSPA